MAKVTSIFKFRPFNIKTIELLIRREIWFAKPNTLNDPFDCAFESHEFFENRDENLELSPEIIKKKIKNYKINFLYPRHLKMRVGGKRTKPLSIDGLCDWAE